MACLSAGLAWDWSCGLGGGNTQFCLVIFLRVQGFRPSGSKLFGSKALDV